MNIDVYDKNGKKLEKISVPDEIFKTEINNKILAQAVRVYLSNQRQGTQSAKTRGEVVGSGVKIYRQKGTGRARHGAKYAPIFVGGGVAFAPKPRDYRLKISKKMKRNALFSALSLRLKENKIYVISGFEKIKTKTKEFIKVLGNFDFYKDQKAKILVLYGEREDNLIKAGRNVKNITFCKAALINPYLILNNNILIFLKSGIEELKNTFIKTREVVKKAKIELKFKKAVRRAKKL